MKAIGGRKCWGVVGDGQERVSGVCGLLETAGVKVERVGGGWWEGGREGRRKAERGGRVYLGRLNRVEVDDRVGRGMGMVVGFGTVAVELVRQCQGIDGVFVRGGCKGMVKAIKEIVAVLRASCQVFGVVERGDEDGLGDAGDDGFEGGVEVDLGRDAESDCGGDYVFAAAWDQGKDSKEKWTAYCNKIEVGRAAMHSAVRLLFDEHQVMVEPDGAIAVAGLVQYLREAEVTGKPKKRAKYVAIIEHPMRKLDALQAVMKEAYTGDDTDCLFSASDRSQRRNQTNVGMGRAGFLRLLNAVSEAEVRQLRFLQTPDEKSEPLLIMLRSGNRTSSLDMRRAITKTSLNIVDLTHKGKPLHEYTSGSVGTILMEAPAGLLFVCNVILMDRTAQSLGAFLTAVQAATPLQVVSCELKGMDSDEFVIALCTSDAMEETGNKGGNIVEEIGRKVAEIGSNLGGKVKQVRRMR